MPTQESHLRLAENNRILINHLLPDLARFGDWVTVVAFYRAVHLVEAVLSIENIHSNDHGEREYALKTNRRYSHIYKNYRPLSDQSRNARYLGSIPGKKVIMFADFLPLDRIKSLILDHHLRQIEFSIERILGTLIPPSGD